METTIKPATAASAAPPPARRNSGQAMVELVVGIVSIVLLTALLVLLGHLQRTDSDSLNRASAEAIADSMGNGIPSSFTPIADWDNGPDGMPYTKDDRAQNGGFVRLRTSITPATAPDGNWGGLRRADGSSARYDAIANVHDGVLVQSSFGFVSARDSETVQVPDFLQSALGLPAEITLRNEVWMPQTGGLY